MINSEHKRLLQKTFSGPKVHRFRTNQCTPLSQDHCTSAFKGVDLIEYFLKEREREREVNPGKKIHNFSLSLSFLQIDIRAFTDGFQQLTSSSFDWVCTVSVLSPEAKMIETIRMQR